MLYDQTTHMHKLNPVRNQQVIIETTLLASAPYSLLQTHTGTDAHRRTCVTSHSAANPMIFPQRRPSTWSEPDALSIRGDGNMCL